MINGIINVYKEKGFTSHDVVAKLRGILRQKKIGHTGTLDPDAEGVLPVCLGNATKLCDMLADRSKTYETILQLGIETDTQDSSGQICKESPVFCTDEEIKAVIMDFVGEYQQIPPMYSAKKINGKKLYELAREGKVVERKPCQVHIYDIVILDIDMKQHRVRMRVHCSKGTYIRTLCHDIGQRLGCGACMAYLLRTQVSQFVLENSLTLDQIQQLTQEDLLLPQVFPSDQAFSGYCSITVKPEADALIYNGNPIRKTHVASCTEGNKELYRIYDSKGKFIGVYTWLEEKKQYKPYKMFLSQL